MHKLMLTVFCVFVLASVATAQHYFAQITGVDAKKGAVTFRATYKKEKKDTDKLITASVTKDCVIREGFFRYGKPSRLEEKELIVNGLKNFIFEKASPDNPLRVNIYTADADDADKGVKKGDIVKILVNMAN